MRTSKKAIIQFFFLLILTFTSIQVLAQAGVGTRNPTGVAQIITGGENVVINNEGKIGVGVIAPKVAIDLRNGANGSMAIGMTDQTATQAGAGALRYDPRPAMGVQGFIEYSNGTEWVGFHPYGRPRIVVIAEKTNDNFYVFETGAVPIGSYTGGLPGRSASYLTSWTEKLDSDSGTPTSNFNPASGEFIAPRDGVYFATFTFALASTEVNAVGSNQIEAIWEVRNLANTIVQRIKTNNGYPSDTGPSPSAVIAGSACTVSVFLNKGEKLRPFAWINVAWTPEIYATSKRPLNNSGGYNVLTIVEQ